jgi:phosphotransferase system HPr (HPr) family protein
VEHRSVVCVPNAQGLHARPCHALVSAALEFRADVRVSCSGRRVNGKSILELMTLSAAQGTELLIEAAGEDAEQAVERLVELIRSGFGESH